MPLLNRKDIKRPTAPARAVESALFGGAVKVRGLMLSEQLAFEQRKAARAKARHEAGETDLAPTDFRYVSEVLALTVLDAEGGPVGAVEDWELWGVQNVDAVMALYSVARELSNLDGEATEKN